MLEAQGAIPIPPQRASEFDHGDVDRTSGRVFIVHTQAGTVEVLNGQERRHQTTIAGCAEASGVLVAQEAGLVFAAARGAGQVLVISVGTCQITHRIDVDPKPNGLAWAGQRQHLLVADVQANTARLVTSRGETQAVTALPGRPRWCVYDTAHDRFLVNIREPACVAVLAGETGVVVDQWSIPSAGPHGLDFDAATGYAYVATDGGQVAQINLADGRVVASVAIMGAPDAIWCNPARHHLYVAIGDPGVIQVVDAAAMRVVQTVMTEPGAHTTAFDPQRQLLYVFLPATCQAGIYLVTPEGGPQ